MADELMPWQIIDNLTTAKRRLTDKKMLAELEAIPSLADENDPSHASDEYWNNVVYPYLALWNLCAERKLERAIPLMLDRACFGDPGEIMRNLCHALEAIVAPNWSKLTGYCIAALKSPRPGTRFWAADELARLRDPSALPALQAAAQDSVQDVRESVDRAIESTCKKMQDAGRNEA